MADEEVSVAITVDDSEVDGALGRAVQSFDDNFAKIAATMAVAGAGLEAWARGQQDIEVATHRVSRMTGLQNEEVRDLAASLSNVTRPMDQVLDTMVLAQQQGAKTTEEISSFVTAWDTVADATGESATALAESGVALRAFGLDATNVESGFDAFGFIMDETTLSVQDFQTLLGRVGPDLQGMNMDLDDAAAIIGILERDFGTSGRALNREFGQAVRNADGDMDQLLAQLNITGDRFDEVRGSVSGMSSAITEQADLYGETFTPLQTWQYELEQLMYRYGSFVEVAGLLAPILLVLAPAIKAVTAAKVLFSAALWASPITWIVLAIVALVAIIVLLVMHWDTVRDAAVAAWDWIWDKLVAFWDWLKDVFMAGIEFVFDMIGAYVDLLMMVWGAAWDGIKAAAQAVWDFIKSYASWLKDTFQKGVEAVMKGVEAAVSWLSDSWSKIWSGIKDTAAGVWDWLTGLPDMLRSAFSNLADILSAPFKAGFNAIARFWNSTAGQLSFELPDWVPGIGGNGFSMPQLPMLAEGGNIRMSGAVMVGEAGPEILDLPRGARVTPLDGGSGGGAGGHVVIELRGDQELVALMRRSIRSRGGNVQVVLGS